MTSIEGGPHKGEENNKHQKDFLPQPGSPFEPGSQGERDERVWRGILQEQGIEGLMNK